MQTVKKALQSTFVSKTQVETSAWRSSRSLRRWVLPRAQARFMALPEPHEAPHLFVDCLFRFLAGYDGDVWLGPLGVRLKVKSWLMDDGLSYRNTEERSCERCHTVFRICVERLTPLLPVSHRYFCQLAVRDCQREQGISFHSQRYCG